MPPRLDGWPVTVSYDLDDVLPDIDVVYLLRIQKERLGGAVDFPTLREYAARWGLTADRASRLKPDTLVSARSLVTEQVANGVAVRMAVLWSLIGSGGPVV
jgi:aspartate carbamoyltransferase catalytic subunit